MQSSTAGLADLTLAEFLERLASNEAVPGGGSASAVAASLAASLLAMVARLSLDRPKYEAYAKTNNRALAAGERARRRLLELADEDARAYAGFAAARRLPRETPTEERARAAATTAAAREATDAPMAVVRECSLLLEEISNAVGRSNLNAASDLEVAARLAAAAARGAAANVLINLPMVDDERYTGAMSAELNGLLRGIDRTQARVAQRIARGQLRPPETA